jgi:hypothetical protein
VEVVELLSGINGAVALRCAVMTANRDQRKLGRDNLSLEWGSVNTDRGSDYIKNEKKDQTLNLILLLCLE